MQDWCPLGSAGQATAANKMYVTLRGEVEISSLGFKQRSVSWDNFGVVGQISRTSFICPPSPQRHIHKRWQQAA